MMIRRFVMLACVALLSCSCSTRQLRDAAAGTLDRNTYRNEYWDFTFHVPDGWHVLAPSYVADSYEVTFRYPPIARPLLTFYRKDTSAAAILHCLVYRSISAFEVMTNTAEETGAKIEMDVNTVTISGESFFHLRLIRETDGTSYSQDIFATESRGDTIAIMLTQDLSLATIEPTEFLETYFAMETPTRFAADAIIRTTENRR